MIRKSYLSYFCVLIGLWFASCTLLPDTLCTSDADCQYQMVCLVESNQCGPKWWVEKLRKRLNEPVTEVNGRLDASESITESKPDTGRCADSCLEGATRECYSGPNGCKLNGTKWVCKGICKAGTQKCVSLAQGECPKWTGCQGEIFPDSKEKCDQLDNNCNDQVDEGCDCKDGTTQACFTKLQGCVKVGGNSFSCTAPCKTGTQQCQNGKWTEKCQGEKGPVTEVCDGIDNDCNGMIDESFPEKGQSCDSTGMGPCKPGIWKCLNKAKVCIPNQKPKTETCDDRDNDCDGKTDEGCVITVAGSGSIGDKNGVGIAAEFNQPSELVVDSQGNIFIADSSNNKVRKIDKLGSVTNFAGSGFKGHKNALGIAAQFDNPQGIAIDSKDNLYIADTGNNRIRKIDKLGSVTTIAGDGQRGDKNGSGATAQFNIPFRLTTDLQGNILIADSGGNTIRKIDKLGNVTTIAGDGNPAFKDALGLSAQFSLPYGLVADLQGNVFVADSQNNRIRKINQQTQVTTVAGDGSPAFKDASALSARFKNPLGVVVDSSGNIFIADTGNHRIRQLDTKGNVTTIAGDGQVGHKDGPVMTAQFDSPYGLFLDSEGNLYIADTGNHRIRKIILP